MVKFGDILKVANKDEGLAKLLESVTVKDTLMNAGFDSLDVMMLAYTLGEEYNVEPVITKNNTFAEIVDQINSLVQVEQG